MAFVTPALLLGSLLVAVPIVMHLVMRRDPQRLDFPALRFLKSHREANRRQLRIRHWLLLALRCAAIALLAFALARPRIQGTGRLGGQEAPVAAVFLFDTAPHMDYRHQNQSRLEKAQGVADWLLTQLPRDSDVAVVDGRGSQPVFAADLGAAQGHVQRLRVAPVGRTLPDALADALQLLDTSEKPSKEVFVFSDLVQSAWTVPSGNPLGDQLARRPDVALYVIDVSVKGPRNQGIRALKLTHQILAQRQPLSLALELTQTGPHQNRVAELLLEDENGNLQKRGRQSIDAIADGIADGGTWLEFPQVGSLAEGSHQGYVQLVGEDGLAWDDKAYFTVEVKPAWPVLVAASRPEDAPLFTELIAPKEFARHARAWFQCDVVANSDLEQQTLEPSATAKGKSATSTPRTQKLRYETLNDYAAICLLDPSPLPQSVWQQLAGYAASGGGVVIYLGRQAEPKDRFNQVASDLLPGRLVRQSRQTTFLAPENHQHPLLSPFREFGSDVPWRAYPVYKYWQMESLSDSARVVVRYANQDPALLEMPIGKGRVITVTTPATDPLHGSQRDPWNLLPTGFEPWPHLALTRELMLYLVGSQDVRLNYVAGETASLQLPSDPPVPMVSLKTPRGDQLRQPTNQEQGTVVFSATDAVGHYRVQAGGHTSGINRGFSVNLAPDACDLTRIGAAELDNRLGKERYQLARNRDEIHREVNMGRVGRELFAWIMALLVIVFAAEQVMANRFHPKVREDDVPAEPRVAGLRVGSVSHG